MSAVTFPVTFSAGSALSNNPLGYQQLSALYQQYRVHRTRLKVTGVPQSGSDNFSLTLFPMGNEPIPSATASNVTTAVMCSQPYARSKTCVYLQSVAQNTVTIDMPIHKILGLTEAEYLLGNWVNINSQPTTNYALYGVHVQIQNGSANASKVVLQFELEQVVELNGLLNPIN